MLLQMEIPLANVMFLTKVQILVFRALLMCAVSQKTASLKQYAKETYFRVANSALETARMNSHVIICQMLPIISSLHESKKYVFHVDRSTKKLNTWRDKP